MITEHKGGMGTVITIAVNQKWTETNEREYLCVNLAAQSANGAELDECSGGVSL